jgi:hypothetical protein
MSIDIVKATNAAPTPAQLALWLQSTTLLDFSSSSIRKLIETRSWMRLPPKERLGAAYDFVRDEIAFGYNASDDLHASQVLADGIGQCNTKGTLLMALFRAMSIPCRLHGFTIDKRLQKGAVTGIAYVLAPQSIIHSWIEAWLDDRWFRLEGFILDYRYLNALQRRFSACQGPFVGYGAATPDLQNAPIEWRACDTFIQKEGINRDYGFFDAPDDFYARHGVNLSGPKRWLFQNVVRHQMNRNVDRIRGEAAGLRLDAVVGN